MPILGAHMSIAGGYYKAAEAAAQLAMDCVQLFTKNNTQWRAKDISEDDVARFRQALEQGQLAHPIAHDSYLINLASPDPALWQKSVDAFAHELERASLLGIPYVVTHPGAFISDSEAAGLERVCRGLDEVHRRTRGGSAQALIETTAGQGSSLGWRFEHLAAILNGVESPERLGVCVDTCHIFAAGYPLAKEEEYEATFAELDRLVGLDRVKAFHVNDSKKPLGSRVDRHAHIGEGEIGLDAFRWLMNDARFAAVPMYLETPKGQRDGVELDTINLAQLRSLAGPATGAGSRKTTARTQG